MAKLDSEDIKLIVDAVVSELDRRKQIEQLADTIIRKQADLNKKLMAAPQQYQRRPEERDAQVEPTASNDGKTKVTME